MSKTTEMQLCVSRLSCQLYLMSGRNARTSQSHTVHHLLQSIARVEEARQSLQVVHELSTAGCVCTSRLSASTNPRGHVLRTSSEDPVPS